MLSGVTFPYEEKNWYQLYCYFYLTPRNFTTFVVIKYFTFLVFYINNHRLCKYEYLIFPFHFIRLTCLVLISGSMLLDWSFKCAVCHSFFLKTFITLRKFPVSFRLLKVILNVWTRYTFISIFCCIHTVVIFIIIQILKWLCFGRSHSHLLCSKLLCLIC